MSDQDLAEVEVKAPEEVQAKPEGETMEEVVTEKNDESVPLKKYMAEKGARKESEERATALEKEIETLRIKAATGTHSAEDIANVNADFEQLASKYPDVSKEFLKDMFSMAKKVSTKELTDRLDQNVMPALSAIEQERQADARDKKFGSLYEKTIKDMPEYEGIVNKEALKALAMSPANAKKTLPQILEETYSAAIQGRKSIEASHASRGPADVDITNPSAEDWERIKSDPDAKKKWADNAQAMAQQYL